MSSPTRALTSGFPALSASQRAMRSGSARRARCGQLAKNIATLTMGQRAVGWMVACRIAADPVAECSHARPKLARGVRLAQAGKVVVDLAQDAVPLKSRVLSRSVSATCAAAMVACRDSVSDRVIFRRSHAVVVSSERIILSHVRDRLLTTNEMSSTKRRRGLGLAPQQPVLFVPLYMPSGRISSPTDSRLNNRPTTDDSMPIMTTPYRNPACR